MMKGSRASGRERPARRAAVLPHSGVDFRFATASLLRRFQPLNDSDCRPKCPWSTYILLLSVEFERIVNPQVNRKWGRSMEAGNVNQGVRATIIGTVSRSLPPLKFLLADRPSAQPPNRAFFRLRRRRLCVLRDPS
jgi:hypothetical protein